jgi:hypothetical protein
MIKGPQLKSQLETLINGITSSLLKSISYTINIAEMTGMRYPGDRTRTI